MEEDVTPFERPDPKVLKIWLVSGLLGYGILIVLLGAVALVLALKGRASLTVLAMPLIPLVLWGISALLLKRAWEHWGFRLTSRTLEIRHGVIWKSYRVVARSRIQHIDINNGPLDRRFGLVQVVIYTAGSVVGMIPGLRPDRAEELRRQLSTSMEPRPPEGT